MTFKKTQRKVNPQGQPADKRKAHKPKAKTKTSAKKSAKRPSKPNPLFIAGGVNPHEGKGAKMAKSKEKKKTASRPSPKAKNPGTKQHHQHKKATKKPYSAPKKKNPNTRRVGSVTGKLENFALDGFATLLGFLFTQKIPQFALQENNKGWAGYAANVAAAFGSAWLVNKFVNGRAAKAMLIGGGAYVVDRILTEKVSPIGQYLQLTGIGDATAAGNLGIIEDNQYTLYPTAYNDDGSPYVPPQLLEQTTRAAMAASQQVSNVAGLGCAGGRGRFSSSRYAA